MAQVSPFSPAELDAFRERLTGLREELMGRIGQMEDLGLEDSLGDSIGEFSTYDNHPADVGSETFERSKDIALRDSVECRVHKVEDALRAIDRGTYGTCEMCGRTIDRERLEALPETTLCVTCKAKGEELPDRHPRPIEEDVITPPWGGYIHDNRGKVQENNMFDGEDAMQILMGYGSSDTPQDVNGFVNWPDVYVDHDEDVGAVSEVESIPVTRDEEGVLMKDYGARDYSEDSPDVE